MSDIPKKAYRCHCGGQRHKHDIQRIAELEAQLAERNQAYGDLVKQLEHSASAWSADNADLREALTKIASGDYDPEEVAEKALKGGSDERA